MPNPILVTIEHTPKKTFATASDWPGWSRSGKTEDADCFFKSTSKIFLDVWNGKKTPSATDFITGAIKSNNPMLLKEFVSAFKK